MTPASPTTISRRGSSDSADEDPGLDLIAGLWQEAPFARLPADAPQELRELVSDVEDPRRVYVIHHASRRHEFQMMVEKYIYQLRYGCGTQTCTTATCFTCRKRLAGKAPIRRYSPLSARTLAVYLAGRDNPEKGLCPSLRIPKDTPPAAAKNLIFGTLPRDSPLEPKRSNSQGSFKSSKCRSKPCKLYESGAAPQRASPDQDSKGEDVDPDSKDGATDAKRESSDFSHSLRDRPTSKDHRSFAANVFGTVAFRMLEWLTPQGMAAISNGIEGSKPSRPQSPPTDGVAPKSPISKADSVDRRAVSSPSPLLNGAPTEKLAPPEPLHSSPQDPTKTRRRPETAFRSPQSWKPRRRASLEPPTPSKTDEPRSPTKSPRPNGFYPEKLGRPLGSPASVTKGIPEIPAQPAFFRNVSSQASAPEDDNSDRSDPLEVMASPSSAFGLTIPKLDSRRAKAQSEPIESLCTLPSEDVECPPPQTLKMLNADIVDFLCDVFAKDNTGEEPLDSVKNQTDMLPKPTRGATPIARKRRRRDSICRRQWKLFSEQTLFSVLSNPRSLISSFTTSGDLFDSHTLWYCMFRLTRAAPNLVFNSLWIAADSLFIAPKTLQEGMGGKSKLFRRNRNALSDFEAGCVMSICLHALAGSIPICPDKQSLRALSWNRSGGLTLSTFPDILDQPAPIREGFDDAFSNDLAVRLARRLCTAVTARRRFAEIVEAERLSETQDEAQASIDVLDPIFNQIDIMGLEATPALEFESQPLFHHQGRMQILMLDWARTVIFNDWDGKPDFATSGPLGGALSIIESMYEQRELLQLAERDFQMGYLSDHLDQMDIAIAWLDFTSTNQRRHFLDYPYLFSSNTLVNFFRSVNFSRMSRTFEESSSLESRMKAIVERGSLITNPHHKMVLQDMLKTASRRYLILEVSRKNVLRDAFDQLWRREERELLRPLKVHFGEDSGEMGFDSGGVQQEFFRMAIAEFLDPHHGAFTVDDRTRMAWFTPGSVVELWKFELFGLLVSLAVFNGLTLPVTFPKALYRKLLNWPVSDLHHIEDGWPDLASGLTQLQEWDEKDGAVEDVFARTYEFSVLTYGSHVTRDMSTADTTWPQVGKTDQIPPEEEAPLVTKDNRDEYINDYIRFLTDVSVRPQFTAFERGFRAALDAKSLTLLSPLILQSLVEGVQTIDISELRRYTRYVGWDASHRTVRDFWSIVKRYDEAMKRRLLEFVTASDRLPVGGVSNLQFVVQKNGEEDGDNGHLPTAYTCYGTLLLPEYRDKEVLRERLSMALENAQGFGFA